MKDGTKSYISVTFHPCESDCFMDPNDPQFSEELKLILTQYFFYIKFVDSFSEIEHYLKPLGQTTSASLEMSLNQKLFVKKTLEFDQVSV